MAAFGGIDGDAKGELRKVEELGRGGVSDFAIVLTRLTPGVGGDFTFEGEVGFTVDVGSASVVTLDGVVERSDVFILLLVLAKVESGSDFASSFAVSGLGEIF